MKKGIVIISNEKDNDATIVSEILKKRGEEVFRFDTQSYSQGKNYIELNNLGEECLRIGGQSVDLKTLKSVWYRKPGEILPQFKDLRDKTFASKELTELLEQIYFLAPQARWVNRPHSVRGALHKYHQLLVAEKLGFKTPRTCVTNSPKAAKNFIESCPSGSIYKTLYSTAMVLNYESDQMDPGGFDIPTSRIGPSHIPQLQSLPFTGGIFQEYIEKEYELRVTVIGDTVFAARINSQKNPEAVGKTDWRFGVQTKGAIETYILPEETTNLCRKLVKKYDLLFGAIDLIKTPGGQYVFLEVNPKGQWAWLEELTGDPYIETFADFLSEPS